LAGEGSELCLPKRNVTMSDKTIALFEGREGIEALIERRCVPEPNSGCLLWEGAVMDGGRPQYTFSVNSKPRPFNVARAVLTKKLGRHPRHTRHTCDVPLCCNEAHLIEGSNKDNAIDYALRGWNRRTGRTLSPDQARDILKSDESYSALMARYGVSKPTVSAIKRRRIWAHLEDI
jgi:hypothetical protein